MTWSLLKMNASFSFIPVNVIASRRKNSVVCVRWACSVCVCKPRAQFEYLCICVFSFYPLCVHIVFLSFSHCHNHIKTHEKKMNTNSEIQTWTINFYFSRQFFFVVLLFLLSCRISLSLHFLTMHCHCCHLICCFIAESVKFWWSSMENVKKKKNLKKKTMTTPTNKSNNYTQHVCCQRKAQIWISRRRAELEKTHNPINAAFEMQLK